MTAVSNTREQIAYHLMSIAKSDPEGLAGVRTTAELAALIGAKRDAARHHLEKLVEDGRIECIGVMPGEPGRPVGWKIAA